MKSSMTKKSHTRMIIDLRDSPDEKSGQAMWPIKNNL